MSWLRRLIDWFRGLFGGKKELPAPVKKPEVKLPDETPRHVPRKATKARPLNKAKKKKIRKNARRARRINAAMSLNC